MRAGQQLTISSKKENILIYVAALHPADAGLPPQSASPAVWFNPSKIRDQKRSIVDL